MTRMTDRFTGKQGQYLAFIDSYMVMHGRAPAEADLAAVLRDHTSDDTSDDPDAGREGTHQSSPWAGPINQASDRSR